MKNFLITLLLFPLIACGPAEFKGKKKEEKFRVVDPPAYVSAFDLTQQESACNKATEIAPNFDVTVESCTLEGSILSLNVKDVDGKELAKSYDLSQAALKLLEETRGENQSHHAVGFYLTYVLCIMQSQPK